MFLMDRFFNGAFLTFGLEVIAFAERDQVSRGASAGVRLFTLAGVWPRYITVFLY